MTVTGHPLPDITLDVDLRNPGQFFACCGLLELASRLWPGTEGWFAGDGSRAAFQIATYSGHNVPFGQIVQKLCETDGLVAIAADEGIEKLQADRQPVIILPFNLRLDWWQDSYGHDDDRRDKKKEKKSPLKTWAGNQTPKGKLEDLQAEWRRIYQEGTEQFGSRLFLARRPMKGRFGFDPSASWEALDVGFSPDEQEIPVLTSLATEILAAVGLQRCRPLPVDGKRRWFAYHPWRTPLEIALASAAVAGVGDTVRAFEFPVVMRNAQYGTFGWANPLEVQR